MPARRMLPECGAVRAKMAACGNVRYGALRTLPCASSLKRCSVQQRI
ncbi:hypothetical protein XOCgx_1394 [Xanthomonas oryzae pv. oryzicola]|nr:hypothetical protein XOCgx_1394 [Xanthomonas oryzae pv. oryzicola]